MQKRTVNNLLEDYIFHKQTLQELSCASRIDRRVLQELLKEPHLALKVHNPRSLNLVVDATYFGDRKEDRDWCVLVARDPDKQENLCWHFDDTETTYGYVLLREKLESLGYTIKSVTGDGFGGIRSAFHGIPFQMCQVHMKRLIVKGTTQNPQTEAGAVLLALVKTLPKTNSHEFTTRFKKYTEKYRDFLNEKTIHPLSGETSWTHEGVRKAYISLMRLKNYLFTFEHGMDIPKTTNSLEGHFKHVKKYLGIHAGLDKQTQQKILAVILQASSVSPSKEVINDLWK